MHKLLRHPLVECDLEEAALWYLVRNPEICDKLVDEARRAMHLAAEHPFQYSIVFGDVRRVRLPGFPHSVYYTADDSQVLVLGIVHGARDVNSVIEGRKGTVI
jgi:plasmid stabilization system protein ParE